MSSSEIDVEKASSADTIHLTSASACVERLASASDLRYCTEMSCSATMFCIVIEFIKLLVYIVAAQSVTYSANPVLTNQKLFSLIYATLVVSGSGFKLWVDAMKTAPLLSMGRLTLTGFVVSCAMLGNLATIFVVACATIPAAGTPIDVIVNSTALIAVAELDSVVLSSLTFNVKLDKKLKEDADTFMEQIAWSYNYVYVAGSLFFFLGLLVYSLTDFTATDDNA